MIRKYSYRKLKEREHSNLILSYLTEPEVYNDIVSVLKKKKNPDAWTKSILRTAKYLPALVKSMRETWKKEGKLYGDFSPHTKEIKQALDNIGQQELF